MAIVQFSTTVTNHRTSVNMDIRNYSDLHIKRIKRQHRYIFFSSMDIQNTQVGRQKVQKRKKWEER